jgi:hypothetical protein
MNQEQIIAMAAKGNEQARAFLSAWIQFCQMLDNLNDKDVTVSDGEMGVRFVQFLTEISGNPFYEAHKAMFYSLMVCSIRAWVDSNKREGVERRVLAGMYHEVVWFAAFLIGQWRHMDLVTSECREYKIDVVTKEQT